MGRPRRELDATEVEARAADGLAEYQIAAALGVSASTLSARKRDTPGIAEALARGQAQAVGAIENVGFACAQRALQDPRYQTSLIFFLKTRAGWKEGGRRGDDEGDGSADRARERLAAQLGALAANGDDRAPRPRADGS